MMKILINCSGNNVNVLDHFKLDGKTALVTGCKRGIGKAMAVALAEAGADIIGVSKTLEPEGSAGGTGSHGAGPQVPRLTPAISGSARLYANSCDKWKRDSRAIDILVNNAGTILRKPAAEHPDEYWDEVIETNLNAQFLISREIGKRMVERGSGKIIFTASLLTFQGGITVPGYAASKGAIGQLTKALANEWAARGRAGQCDRAGLHQHGQHGCAASRSGPQSGDSVAHPGRPLGRAGRFQRRRRLPGLPRLRLRDRHDPDGRWRMDGALKMACRLPSDSWEESCRKRRPSSERVKTRAREKRLPHRRVSSCARRWTIFARASTEPGRRSRLSRSGFQRPAGQE